jgi:hypothetical protein
MLEKQQTPLAKFIEDNPKRSGYSFEEIGIMCGFKTADLIYAFMRGEIRLPLDKVVPMAEALSCDSGQLFTLALKEWFSQQIFEQMEEAFLAFPSLDTVELGWLKVIRDIFGGKVPEINDRFKRRLQLVLSSA